MDYLIQCYCLLLISITSCFEFGVLMGIITFDQRSIDLDWEEFESFKRTLQTTIKILKIAIKIIIVMLVLFCGIDTNNIAIFILRLFL